MNPKELDELIQEMWDKHATADHHGYRDWMHEVGFSKAVKEIVKRLEKSS